MCLIAFQWLANDADQRLVLIANRDEFFDRPTAPLHEWENEDLVAGKDLKEGGTWMGVRRTGRFAALTNFRSREAQVENPISRGYIATDFLRSANTPERFLETLAHTQHRYNGFNLLCGDLLQGELWWFSNRSDAKNAQRIEAGTHGVSNALLNTPWPKLRTATQALESAINDVDHTETLSAQLLAVLQQSTAAPDAMLPQTGIPLVWERHLSSIFIPPFKGDKSNSGETSDQTKAYGTRSSSVFIMRGNVITWTERSVSLAGMQSVNLDVRKTIILRK